MFNNVICHLSELRQNDLKMTFEWILLRGTPLSPCNQHTLCTPIEIFFRDFFLNAFLNAIFTLIFYYVSLRETRHSVSLMSNLLSSFPWERMARIKRYNLWFTLVFASYPVFFTGQRRKMFSGFYRQSSVPISSLSVLSPVTLLLLSFSSSYSFPSISIFVFWGRLPNAKALKIVLLSLLGDKGESTRMNFIEISAKCFWDCAEKISEKDNDR